MINKDTYFCAFLSLKGAPHSWISWHLEVLSDGISTGGLRKTEARSLHWFTQTHRKFIIRWRLYPRHCVLFLLLCFSKTFNLLLWCRSSQGKMKSSPYIVFENRGKLPPSSFTGCQFSALSSHIHQSYPPWSNGMDSWTYLCTQTMGSHHGTESSARYLGLDGTIWNLELGFPL